MAMLTRTHVLIAEQFNGGIKLDGTGTTSLNQPPNRVDWASMYDELVWQLSIGAAPSGGPTTWAITAKFQYRQMHGGTTTFRFQTPRWVDLSDEQIATHVVEGVGWYGPGQADQSGSAGTIATQASTLTSPIIVSRSLRHFPQGVRLVIGATVTGGTGVRLPLGLEVTGKGPR